MDGNENGERAMRQRRGQLGKPSPKKGKKPTHEVVATWPDGRKEVVRRSYSKDAAYKYRAERIRGESFRSVVRGAPRGPVYSVRPVGEP